MVSAEIVAKSSAYNVVAENLKEEYKDILKINMILLASLII